MADRTAFEVGPGGGPGAPRPGTKRRSSATSRWASSTGRGPAPPPRR